MAVFPSSSAEFASSRLVPPKISGEKDPTQMWFFEFSFTHISGKTDVLSNDLFSAKYIPLTANKKTGFKNSALFGICTEHST